MENKTNPFAYAANWNAQPRQTAPTQQQQQQQPLPMMTPATMPTAQGYDRKTLPNQPSTAMQQNMDQRQQQQQQAPLQYPGPQSQGQQQAVPVVLTNKTVDVARQQRKRRIVMIVATISVVILFVIAVIGMLLYRQYSKKQASIKQNDAFKEKNELFLKQKEMQEKLVKEAEEQRKQQQQHNHTHQHRPQPPNNPRNEVFVPAVHRGPATEQVKSPASLKELRDQKRREQKATTASATVTIEQVSAKQAQEKKRVKKLEEQVQVTAELLSHTAVRANIPSVVVGVVHEAEPAKVLDPSPKSDEHDDLLLVTASEGASTETSPASPSGNETMSPSSNETGTEEEEVESHVSQLDDDEEVDSETVSTPNE